MLAGRAVVAAVFALVAYLSAPTGRRPGVVTVVFGALGAFLADRPLPWSAAALIAFLTVDSYRRSSSPGKTPGRLVVLLALRFLALALTMITIVRPALLVRSDDSVPSVLLLAVDYSRSMTIKDEFNNQTRWQAVQSTLQRCENIIQRLQDERQISVVTVGFAHRLVDGLENLTPSGPSSDYGGMLAQLWERFGQQPDLRGLLIVGDGADNGRRFQAALEARRFRAVRCPIHGFVVGQPVELDRRRDIAITEMSVEPNPAYIKGRMVFRAVIDAVGFENAEIEPRLRLNGELVALENVAINGISALPKPRLTQSTGNELTIEITAPEKPGEYRVSLEIPSLPGESSTVNNEVVTFATVSKEGVSVLLVAPLDEETKFLRRALAADPRIRLFELTRQTDTPRTVEGEPLNFQRQAYDVMILRNVSPRRLSGGDASVLEAIRQQVVDNGMGLMMMGGFDSFGGSPETQSVGAWSRTPIASLLPVEVDKVSGHVDSRRDGVSIGLYPTPDGENHFLLRLDGGKKTWERLHDTANRGVNLLGMNRLGAIKPTATLLATAQPQRADLPLMAAHSAGRGRVLAFAGDTTYLWRLFGLPESTEGVQIHQRFWKQTVLWLAQQENTEGYVWAKLDFRRLPTGQRQGFSVGIRGKSGLPLQGGEFKAKVVGPGDSEQVVPIRREGDAERGEFWQTVQPGEYRVQVTGRATDADGNSVEGQAEARFVVYEDDREMLQTAADPDFLAKLSAEAGGPSVVHRLDELPDFLQRLREAAPTNDLARPERYPDWRQPKLTAFLPLWLILLTLVLASEWALRRLWGMA